MGRRPFQIRLSRMCISLNLVTILWILFGGTAAADYTDLLRRGEEACEASPLSAITIFHAAIREEPKSPTAYVKAAEAYYEAINQSDWSYGDVPGKSLWAAPDDRRKHAEPPYRFSILGEPRLPTEPSYEGTIPIEVLRLWDLAEQATRLAPDNAIAWRWLGEAHLILAEKAEAERCFRRAVELAPQDPTLQNRVGQVYYNEERPAEALPYLMEAVRLAPSESAYLLDRCACRWKVGDVDGTTADLKAFGIAPEGVAELERMAAASDPKITFQQGATILSRYIRLRPEDATTYDDRSDFLTKLKDYERALSDADSALAIRPNHPLFLYRRAYLLRALGRNKEALGTIDRLLELRPYAVDVEVLRALCLGDLGRHREAQDVARRIKWLRAWLKNREAIEGSPGDAAAWLEGGRLALEGAEQEAAKTCFEKAVSLRPGLTSAHAGLAAARLKLGDPKAALAAVERAVELAPEDGGSLSTRAEIRLTLGDFDGAIADYEHAHRAGRVVGPEIAEAYLRRAAHRQAGGDAAGAAADRKLAEALESNPFIVP